MPNYIKIPLSALLISIICGWLVSKYETKPITKTTTNNLTATKPTTSQLKILPNAIKAFNITIPKVKLGFKDSTVVLQSLTQTIQVNTPILAYGFSNKFGLFLGANLSGFDGGLTYSPIYYWRVAPECLVGLKGIGVGADFQVFRNSWVGIADTWRYDSLIGTPSVFISLGF